MVFFGNACPERRQEVIRKGRSFEFQLSVVLSVQSWILVVMSYMIMILFAIDWSRSVSAPSAWTRTPVCWWFCTAFWNSLMFIRWKVHHKGAISGSYISTLCKCITGGRQILKIKKKKSAIKFGSANYAQEWRIGQITYVVYAFVYFCLDNMAANLLTTGMCHPKKGIF